MTSITIPNSVTNIGEEAFQNSNLISIDISENLQSIRQELFSGCLALTSISLPSGINSIGANAFSGCGSMTAIAIPDKVIEIGPAAFANCSNLFSITIPNGVTKILEDAFSNCRSLPSISIPDSVTEIGNSAFENCRNLTSVSIPTAFHNESEARRLSLFGIWPQGFLLPPTKPSETAEAKAILANGFLVGIEIQNGMGGYVVPPEITITGGGGSGATGVSILDDGVVVGVEITNTGRGYSSPPTITIAPPPVPETQIAIRLVPAITVTGGLGQTAVIEIADFADGPWFEWRTIEIEENGATEVDLVEDSSKRFYRVRDK